jgi:hypothetical protein
MQGTVVGQLSLLHKKHGIRETGGHVIDRSLQTFYPFIAESQMKHGRVQQIADAL